MEDNFKTSKRQESRIIAGLILVCVGVALLLRNAGYPFLPHWLFSWPVILILIGIYSGFKHNFRNNTWIILIGVGSFFLFDRFVPELKLAPAFWPVVIIAIGVLCILRPNRNRWLHYNDDEKKNDPNVMSGSKWGQAETGNYATDNNDFLKISSVFSGVQRNIVSKNFQGGRISCVFGGADIDFTQADLTGKKEIRLEVIFGGVKLVVPPHWTVYNEIDGVFHGVDDKRKYKGETNIDPEKVLLLKGSVTFGGVEIKSY